MSTTIVGLFDQPQAVESLRQEIISRGVADRDIETLSWKGGRAGSAGWGLDSSGATESDRRGKLTKHLKKWGVSDEDADDFAEAVRRGGLLVLTRVDDDSKVNSITDLMEQREAVDLDSRRKMWRGSSTDAAKSTSAHKDASTQDARAQRGRAQKMQEAHEELHIAKKEVPVGKVRVHKRVEEEPVKENIELKSENIEIERRPIDSSEAGAVGPDVFEEGTIEFTEYAEKPVVEKEVRLDDEYVAKKTVESHQETIEDTVRRTVLDIEPMTEGLSAEESFETLEPGYREHFNNNYGDQGEYSDYEHAYRFGHAFGASDQHQDRGYDDIEPDLRSSYEDRYGQGSFGNYGGAARHAFDSFRNRRTGRSSGV